MISQQPLPHSTATADAPPTTTTPPNFGAMWSILLIMILSVALRYTFIASNPYPLNDGGLYYQALVALIENNMRLPEQLIYNGLDLALALPPLPLVTLGYISQWTGIEPLIVMRWYPLVLSILTIPVMYLLAQTILENKREALLATIAFALLPANIVGILDGSGTSNATGMLLGIVTTLTAFHLNMKKERRSFWALITAVLIAGTFLSNLYWGLYTLITLFMMRLRSRNSGLRAAIFFRVSIIIALLLLVPFVLRLTLEPYTSQLFNLGILRVPFALFFAPFNAYTLEPALGIWGVMGFVGFFLLTARDQGLMAVWMLLLILIIPLNATQVIAVPLSISIGLALDFIILTGIASFRLGNRRTPGTRHWLGSDWAITTSYLAIAMLILLSSLNVLQLQRFGAAGIQPIAAADLRAMRWIEATTDPEATFLLLTGELDFTADPVASWFPIITKRVSINGVEGTEWLPDEEFQERIVQNAVVQACIIGRSACQPNTIPLLASFTRRFQSSESSIPPESVCIIRHVPLRYANDARIQGFDVTTMGRQLCLPFGNLDAYTHIFVSSRTGGGRLAANLATAGNSNFTQIYNTDGARVFERN